MATLNFPDAPDTGDTYTDSNSGFTYEWNGTVWISIDPSTASNIREIDDISSSFNGTTSQFTLQVSGVNIEPDNVQQLIISVGGVMQNAGDDYTISSSTITFTTAPSSSLTFFGTYLGTALSINTVADGSVSPSSFTTTSNYMMGGLTVDQSAGIVTAYQFKGDGSQLTGVASTDNIITNTDARFNANVSIAGSLTVQGTETIINVDELNVQDKTIGIGSTSSPSSTTQDGAGAIIYGQTHVTVLYENDKAALSISTAANVSGFITATSYYGDGSNLTGVGASLYPLTYSPGISSTGQPFNVGEYNIQLEWSYPIKVGTGTIELREGSASGTVKDQFVVGTSNSITFANNVLTMDPAVALSTNTSYFVVIPANAVKSLGDQQQNSLINAYSYTTKPQKNMEMFAWGINGLGQINGINGVPQYFSSPVQIPGSSWAKLGGNINMKMAIKNDGALWTWGDNEEGELGLNNVTYLSSPTQVGTDTTWSLVSDGDGSSAPLSLATKTNGTLWAWGNNQGGQLGQNATGQHSSPTQVGTDTTWSKDGPHSVLASGYQLAMAIKTNGTLWVWGSNEHGQLGLNISGGPSPTGYDKVSSPMQIGTETTWQAVRSSGMYGMTALKTNGTLWSWGQNENGVLGLNDGTSTYSSPTQIGTDTTWSILTGGGGRYSEACAAIKTDGTLWTWGNNQGFRGVGSVDTAQYSSPTQVGTNTNWASVRAMRTVGALMTKTDGTLWSLGQYTYNGLNGPSAIVNISSPTQVGTDTNWTKINGEALDAYSYGSGDGLLQSVLKLE